MKGKTVKKKTKERLVQIFHYNSRLTIMLLNSRDAMRPS